MSDSDFDQMSAAQKATMEALAAIMRTSFDGMQRLAELNMAAARNAFSSNVSTISKLAASKDLSAMAPLGQELAKPERMMEYWHDVYSLVSAMQKDVTAVMQANYGQLAKSAAAAIEQKMSSGTDGSDAIADVMKNMLEQGNKAFDNMAAMASQMTSMANAQIQSAASAMAGPAGSGAKGPAGAGAKAGGKK
ncbi:MAG: phasin family protein [Betaproteobacteria bacterium]|jgi:phasin family protein|nr:phasin family protein [Betaproteobacteria bacterium]